MLIFLDIDGVMVPAKSWEKPELLNDGFPAFNLRAVSALQSIISDGVTVMLTTSHKSSYSIDEWKNIFERRGIKVNKLKSLDSNVNNLTRKEEILNWFNVNTCDEDFIIIDDDKSLNDLPKFLKDNLVLTNSMVGLTDQHLQEIKLILNRGLQKV
ncbi:MAG: HAD domain-containing protein [Bacteroidota bacterium]|nr:HAD domain-containing protein [Bacteroidota bacterium]